MANTRKILCSLASSALTIPSSAAKPAKNGYIRKPLTGARNTATDMSPVMIIPINVIIDILFIISIVLPVFFASSGISFPKLISSCTNCHSQR